MPTTNTRYVDVDADAGGDGTTNGLSGGTCAYKSLSIWEAARDDVGDLVTNDSIEDVVCGSAHASHTADTGGVVIDGWTTDATRYINIRGAASDSHLGVYDATKYRLAMTNSTALNLNEQYVRVNRLQLYTVSATANGKACLVFGASAAGGVPPP